MLHPVDWSSCLSMLQLSSNCVYKCALCWCCAFGSVTCLCKPCSLEETCMGYGRKVTRRSVCHEQAKKKHCCIILFAKQTQIIYKDTGVNLIALPLNPSPMHPMYVIELVTPIHLSAFPFVSRSIYKLHKSFCADITNHFSDSNLQDFHRPSWTCTSHCSLVSWLWLA